jgi:carbonic anhydrase
MLFATRVLPFLLAAVAAGTAAAQRTPDEALRALRDGNERFAANRSLLQPLGEGVRRTLARGQSPFAVVLCCADSRVPPEHVFNCGLGELVVVRVAGHVADPETVASIEYAVEQLGAPLAVVLAHEHCGAVAAGAAQAHPDEPHAGHSAAMQQLLERIEPAVRKARERALGGKELLDACEEEHAHATVHDCLRRSALLRRHASAGRFRMVAARYDLDTGAVEWLPPRPEPLDAPAVDVPLPADAAAGMPPHVALRLLQAGHRRFLGDGKPTADLTPARREQLVAAGQQPLAIVLACADSRTPPEHVFDAGLGELFVVRVAGATLNDAALASIEHAATQLGASLLVVMGHSHCDALAAAAARPETQQLSPNQRALLLRLEPAVAAARAHGRGRDVVEHAARAHALRTVAEARSRSASLRRLEHEGRLTMLGCVYDVASGDLEWLKDTAVPHATDAAPRAALHAAANGAAHDVPAPYAAPAPQPAPAVEIALPGGAHPPAPAHRPAHDPARAPASVHEHAEHAAPAVPHAAPAAGPRAPWQDPIVLVGGFGVLSLLAAALLAIRRR